MYKEIVTKAVIGKGKKLFKNTYTLLVDNNANTALGCWVINHKFKGYVQNNKVVIDGSFDINIWYSYDNDKKTSVATKNIHYTETVLVNLKNSTSLDGSDIIVRVLKEPSCSNVKIKDDVIEFDIEKELGIEVINDTKVKIAALEDEDAWENLNDEEDNVSDIKEEKEDQTKEDTVMENIDNEVKEDFI